MKFETLAIHAGQEPDPNNGAVMTPVYLTSTYRQDGVARPRQGYEYSRTQNPTRNALQDCLAVLESGSHGFAFASGLAATDTVLRLLRAGDHVLAAMTSMAAHSAYLTRCSAASTWTLRSWTPPIRNRWLRR